MRLFTKWKFHKHSCEISSILFSNFKASKRWFTHLFIRSHKINILLFILIGIVLILCLWKIEFTNTSMINNDDKNSHRCCNDTFLPTSQDRVFLNLQPVSLIQSYSSSFKNLLTSSIASFSIDKNYCDVIKSISSKFDKLDNYHKQYWNGTLSYCSNLNFCSQLLTSEQLKHQLEAELSLPYALNENNNFNFKCELQKHKFNSFTNLTLTNVYFFNYSHSFYCLKHLLTSDSFYDCPSDIAPCLVPNISHVVWMGTDRPLFRFHHYISVCSNLMIIRPHVLLIWFETIPHGDWFLKLLRFARDKAPITKIFLVKRNGIDMIYNRPVNKDIARLVCFRTQPRGPTSV